MPRVDTLVCRSDLVGYQRFKDEAGEREAADLRRRDLFHSALWRFSSKGILGLYRGTATVTQHNKQWCVVYTKAQREEFAEVNLHLRGIDTFFPKLFLPKSAKRKKQIVPLFPNYLFVCVDVVSEEYGSIIWCPGVKRMVSFNGTPAIVEESIMAFLMGQAGTDGVISARCNVTVGQQVAIDGGPFDGLVGIIQEPPNARGRVKILLELLSRPTKVDVPVQFIKASWVTSESLGEG